MTHTNILDDKYTNVENILQYTHHCKQKVNYKTALDDNAVSEGYMTVEQFRTEAKMSLTKILNEHGIY